MKKKSWLRYLSVLMTLILTMAMMPANLSLASEEGRIVLTSFEELKDAKEAAEKGTNIFPLGTEEEDLNLPETIKAYDEVGTEYELEDLEWTILLKEDEKKVEEEDAEIEPEEYDPETTLPGEYVFTLKLSEEYELGEDVKLPKVKIIIAEPETETELVTEAPTEPVTEAPTEPVTEAPVTEAPVTEAPVTEAPATEAPVTEAPVTEAPVTEEPVTEAPVTEAPVTEEPVTEAPVTEAPVTEAPVTEAPVTEAPVTEAPVTEAPVTEAPVTEAPVTEAPVTEAPATEAPVTEILVEDISEGTDTLSSDSPMVSLILPEKMEVGKSYQLQYAISNEDLASAGEASVSYSVQAGAEYIDMPDQSGNFTVLGEGTVAFQVDVQLQNGTELQAYSQSMTVPAETAVDSVDESEEVPTVNDPGAEDPVLSNAAEVTEIKLGDLTAAADENIEALFTLTLPCDSTQDLTQVKLTITYSEGASLVILEGTEGESVQIPYTEETVLDFSDGKQKTLQVTAEDSTTISSYQIAVTKRSHTPGEMTTVSEATCTTDGLKEQHCTVCPALIASEPIPAGGHTSGEMITVSEATCTTDGLKEQKCTVCQTVTATETIPSAGHTLGEWETTKEATCTEKGEKIQKCTVCGETVNTEVIEALGHKAKKKWQTTKEATCTKDGKKVKKCKRCGEVLETKVIEALGHDWGTGTAEDEADAKEGWSVTVKPTTSSKGKMERTCQRDDCGVTETKEIQRLNIIGQAANNVIWGFSSEATYPENSVITFEAIGDGMDNDDPISGDVRYVPTSTWNLLNDYEWGNSGYTASFRITKAGNYTLKITFQKQTYDGSQWVNSGETSTVEQNFIISGTGEFTDENGNGTGNTQNPDEVIGGGVKTGDNTPVVVLTVVLAAALIVLIILGIIRKKK